MSDTPRTDAEPWINRYPEYHDGATQYVKADFARTLERELAAAIRERDTAKRRANKIAAEALVVTEQLDQLADALKSARRHILERNGLCKDSDRGAALAINAALAAVKADPTAVKPQPTHTFNGHPVTLVSNNGPLTGMVEIQRADGSTEYVYPSELIPL